MAAVVAAICYYMFRDDYDLPTAAAAALMGFLVVWLSARSLGAPGGGGAAKKGDRLPSRKLSFMSEVLAKGAFPAHLKVPDFPINGVLYMKEVPTQAEMEELVLKASKLDRLHSIPVEQPNGEWFWQPVADFDVHDHLYIEEVRAGGPRQLSLSWMCMCVSCSMSLTCHHHRVGVAVLALPSLLLPLPR